VLNWKPTTALPAALLFTLALAPAFSAPAAEDDDDEKPGVITEIVVTASRLDIARAKLEPSLGASTYTLSNEAVESRPGSETVSIGQIPATGAGCVSGRIGTNPRPVARRSTISNQQCHPTGGFH
jgi:hypothetical protein